MNAPAIIEARAQWIAEGAPATSKMRQLPEEHFTQIVEWLLDGIPATKVAALAAEELKLPPAKLPHKTGLYEFWESFSRYWLMARRRLAARDSTALREEIARSPEQWEAATLDQLQQRAFEVLSDPTASAKDLKGLVTLLFKHRDQTLKGEQIELQKRRLSLLESQSEAAKKTLGDTNLTPAQREARMREIFGIA